MSKTFTFTTLLALTLLLHGCTAHYRQSLRDFRKGKTTSFYQRTLDWTARAGTEQAQTRFGAAATTTSLGRGQDTSLGRGQDTSQDAISRNVALILGMNPAELEARIEKLSRPEDLEQVFARQVRWDDFALTVALHNPEVRAARADWEATLRQYEQADYLEGLIGQFRTFTRYLNIETGEPLNQQMMQNYFPYPSVMAYKGEMIRQMARMAELDWQKMLRDSIVMAGDKYFQYQYLARAQAATQENVKLLDDLVKVMEDRYRTGLVNQASVLKTQNELATQRNALLDLQSQERTSKAQLNALIGRQANSPLGVPMEANLPIPSVSYAGLTEAANTHRQELLAQRAAIGRTQAAIRMSEVMNRPPASRGFSALERGMMPESSAGQPIVSGASSGSGMSSSGASASTSAGPVFGEAPRPATPGLGFAQAEAYIAETRKRLEGDQDRLKNIELQTQALARSSLEDLDVARRKVELLERTILPQTQSAYQISLSDYTSGNTTFLDLLDTERELINTRLMVHEAHRDLNQAILRLANIAGYFLSR